MKYIKIVFLLSSLLLLSLLVSSCITDPQSQKQSSGIAQDLSETPDTAKVMVPPPRPLSLPVKYQTASYVVNKQETKDTSMAEESKLKVGARITSTQGPQPLWDILKRLAALKGMNVSWASDVDQNVLVDVNIGSQDDFYLALDNLLRQVDYHHEMQGSTIIVKYKETRQFHIAMPFIKQTYKTNTGGDVLGGGSETSTNVAGEISLSTEGVAINNLRDGTPGGIEFNTWSSIENNLNSILSIWSTDEVTASDIKESEQTEYSEQNDQKTDQVKNEQAVAATFRRSTGGNTYFIDKPVGLITVTAPRPLINRLEDYFKTLKRELYKQVAIEAKVIEVQLDDHSSIGLNWNKLLTSLSVAGGSGTIGKTYSKSTSDNENSSTTWTRSQDITSSLSRTRDSDLDASTDDTGTTSLINNISSAAGSVAESGISAATIISEGLTGSLGGAISLAAFSFDSFLNAVNEQGQSTILSNPRLSVLNGQPALITVGRNVTYIDNITVEEDEDTNSLTYSVETERALSGVGLALTANILDDNEVILNLVPVTSELQEPIEYRSVGLGQVGLPIINVREMSTTVRVKDGSMLVIGGLISNVAENEGTFVPGTKNLGFFKYLFGFEEKTSKKRELIILLKPRII